MKKVLLIFVFAALLITEPYLGRLRVRDKLEGEAVPTPTELVLQSLGEIRYTLAAYLWLQTEIYHHELGLNMVKVAVGSQDARKVGEILAICRLVTRLDPQFVQAYDVGYWRLAKSLEKMKEAVAFLQEGLRNNPESALLNQDMGQLYFIILKDCKNAIPYEERAAYYAEKSLKPGQDQTPLGNDLRILGHCYLEENQPEKAGQVFQHLLSLFPGDPYAKIQLRRLPPRP